MTETEKEKEKELEQEKEKAAAWKGLCTPHRQWFGRKYQSL